MLAHALGTPIDQPLPLAAFIAGAGSVVAFSWLFAAAGGWWRPGRCGHRGGRSIPEVVKRLARFGMPFARAVVLAAFAGVLFAAFAGRDIVNANVAPRVVYVVFWVGFTVTSFAVGDVWRAVSPFDTLCAIGQWIRRCGGSLPAAPIPYPAHWGYWPAAGLLLGSVWLALVVPDSAHPRTVGLAMASYTAVMLTGAATWGRDWLRVGDAFAVWFGLLSQAAPVFRGPTGELCLRPPLCGLSRPAAVSGQAAFVFAGLGSAGFYGLTRTAFWADLTGDHDGSAGLVLGALGLMWMVAAAAVVFVVAVRVAARRTGAAVSDLVQIFLPSLVPISFGYALAQSLAPGLFESQTAVALASDPLGRGWDLFGTADWMANLTFVSGNTIAYVQAGVTVAAHAAAVRLVHAAIATHLDGPGRTQVKRPLLAPTLLYSVGGLALLLGR